ncbi:MAG: META domain-containing protein [Ruaniaceae bacterium]|nr:META domain-containing protein [Ruaniaceae bacterium]
MLSAAAIAVTLLGAAACGSSTESDLSPVGTWSQEAENSPFLEIAEDGTLSGNDGCNVLGGDWTSPAAGEIETSGLVGTMMFCEGVDDWLSAFGHATFTADTMTVYSVDDQEIGTLSRP